VITVRPMALEDLEAAMDVSARAFELDIAAPHARDRWRERVLYTFRTDPAGAFVAEADGEIVGVAEALVRERLWVLSLLTVDPGRQSGGAGRGLFEAALGYGPADGPGLIVASDDPRALRLYGGAGFSPIPTFNAFGVVDPARFGRPDPEIELVPADEVESLAQVAREVRGAPLTRELHYARSRGETIFRLADRGFVVATRGEGIWSLAARDAQSATRLLRRGLAHAAGADPIRIRWITESQGWAIAAASEAGMQISPYGALFVRGEPGTLDPFLPSGPFA